jgi:hypothetical protein
MSEEQQQMEDVESPEAAEAGEVEAGATEEAPAAGAEVEEATQEEQAAAVTKLQAMHRGNKDRAAVAKEKEEMTEATTKIQANFRGKQARQQLKGGADGDTGEGDADESPEAAEAGEAEAGATEEAPAGGAEVEEATPEEQAAAATKLQAMHRGKKDRAAVAKEKEEMTEATTKIQANFRGNADRKRVQALKGEDGEIAETGGDVSDVQDVTDKEPQVSVDVFPVSPVSLRSGLPVLAISVCSLHGCGCVVRNKNVRKKREHPLATEVIGFACVYSVLPRLGLIWVSRSRPCFVVSPVSCAAEVLGFTFFPRFFFQSILCALCGKF